MDVRFIQMANYNKKIYKNEIRNININTISTLCNFNRTNNFVFGQEILQKKAVESKKTKVI